MADPTQYIVDRLISIYTANVDKFKNQLYPIEFLEDESQIRLREFQVILERNSAIDLEQADTLMAAVGRLAGLAEANGLSAEAARMLDFSAAILAQILVPNTDLAIRCSLAVSRTAGNRLELSGQKLKAAISRTNAAMRYLRLENVTDNDLKASVQLFEQSTKVKRKLGNRGDLAFSEFNHAIAIRRQADNSDPGKKIAKYKQSWSKMRKAVKLLSKTDTQQSLPVNIIAENIVDILLNWRLEVSDREEQRNNASAMLGPDEAELEYARDLIKGFISDGHDSSAVVSLKYSLWRLSGLLENGYVPGSESFAHLNKLWLEGRVLEHTRQSLDFVGHGDLNCDEYITMLSRLLDGVAYFRAQRDHEDIFQFILQNALTIRHAAVDLGFAGEGAKCFRGLEICKGLVANEPLDYPVADPMEIGEDVVVHLAHNPNGVICLIARKNNGIVELKTETITIQNMHEFNSLFIEIDADTGRTHVVSNLNYREILNIMAPVARFIESVTKQDDRIVMIPVGFFQSFPVHAIECAPNRYLIDVRKVSVAPSAGSLVKGGPASYSKFQCLDAYAVADEVPGYKALPYGKIESSALGSYFSARAKVVAPVSVSVLEVLRYAKSFHFSGHSFSSPNPWEGGIVLDDRTVSVEEMANANRGVMFGFFNSCESGASQNLFFSEEDCSLQSILYYGGAQAVVGTTWPVEDKAAFAFAVLFYCSLASESVAWADAYQLAIRKLKDLTASQFSSMVSVFDGDAVSEFDYDSGDRRLFSDFRYWAPFSIMSREFRDAVDRF